MVPKKCGNSLLNHGFVERGVSNVNGGRDWFNEILKWYITKISKQWILDSQCQSQSEQSIYIYICVYIYVCNNNQDFVNSQGDLCDLRWRFTAKDWPPTYTRIVFNRCKINASHSLGRQESSRSQFWEWSSTMSPKGTAPALHCELRFVMILPCSFAGIRSTTWRIAPGCGSSIFGPATSPSWNHRASRSTSSTWSSKARRWRQVPCR